MTRKDYELIVACLGGAFAKARNNAERKGIESVMTRVVLEFGLENPRFKPSTFYERIEYWRVSHSKEV